MENILQEFLIEKALILVPVLWVIGAILKNTPAIKDWLIPYILLICGIVGGLVLVGFNADGVVQGIVASGVAVLGHQLLKQYTDNAGGDGV